MSEEANVKVKWLTTELIPVSKIDMNEMKRVIIHGCLHLVGFDDTTDNEKKIMREKEQEYINTFNQNVIIICQ